MIHLRLRTDLINYTELKESGNCSNGFMYPPSFSKGWGVRFLIVEIIRNFAQKLSVQPLNTADYMKASRKGIWGTKAWLFLDRCHAGVVPRETVKTVGLRLAEAVEQKE